MAHENRYTPDEIRGALARSLLLMEDHQAAAAELLLDYNGGRIARRADWLRQFVALGAAGRKASLRWGRLSRALSGGEDVPSEWTDALQPYSDTERSVMGFAVDLGSDRWQSSRWDRGTRRQIIQCFTEALKVAPSGRGTANNTIIGNTTGTTIQTNDVHGDIIWS